MIIAQELKEHNIIVNAYAPGFIDTPMGEYQSQIAHKCSIDGTSTARDDERDKQFGGPTSSLKRVCGESATSAIA